MPGGLSGICVLVVLVLTGTRVWFPESVAPGPANKLFNEHARE